MNSDQILALLAMDAYNQGFGAGVDGVGTKIGGASVVPNDELPLSAELQNALNASGFNATTYSVAGTNTDLDGTIVISYRGSDDLNDAANDAQFTSGVGVPSQAALAAKYYQAIKSKYPDKTIVLTGHSLGGALAGTVGSLYGTRAVLYNNVPFEITSTFIYAAALLRAAAGPLVDLTYLGWVVPQDIVDTFYPDGNIPEINRTYLKALVTPGDVAGNIRMLQAIPTISVGSQSAIDNLTAVPSVSTWLNVIFGFLGAGLGKQINLHWQSFLNIKEFSAVNGYDSLWTPVYNQTVGALYSDEIANAAGITDFSTMQKKIAYSVIDPSMGADQKPFGDTAIASMFNDYTELGSLFSDGATPASFFSKTVTGWLFGTVDVTQEIANLATQYAGALAQYDVEVTELRQVLGAGAGADDGIVAVDDDGTALALDLSSILWGDVLKAGGVSGAPDRLKPIYEDAFRAAFFDQSAETNPSTISRLITGITGFAASKVDEEALKKLAAFWEASSGSIFDRYHIATSDDDHAITLSERSYKDKIPETKGDQVHVDVYIGTQSNDEVHGTSGNDLLILGAGNDVVYSRGGRDMVLGGTGNDEFIDQIGEVHSPQDDGSDIYVGDTLDKSMVQGFLDYLRGLVGAGDVDKVHYSVEDPVTHQLAAKGLQIVSGELVTYGTSKGIKLTVRDLNTGQVSSDIMIDIDIVELSERADFVSISDDLSKLPVIVDLSAPKSGVLGEQDFDTVSFEARTNGVITINGSVADNSGGAGGIVDLTNSVALKLLRAFFKPEAELHFRGAENVILTSKDDVYFGGNLSNLLGVQQGFFGTANHDGFGKISGGDGKDLLVYYGAGHKDAGEPHRSLQAGRPEGGRGAVAHGRWRSG